MLLCLYMNFKRYMPLLWSKVLEDFKSLDHARLWSDVPAERT